MTYGTFPFLNLFQGPINRWWCRAEIGFLEASGSSYSHPPSSKPDQPMVRYGTASETYRSSLAPRAAWLAPMPITRTRAILPQVFFHPRRTKWRFCQL